MNCPKCKNPIEANSTICEWCGANCINSTENKSPINSDLDTEITTLLSQKTFSNGNSKNILSARNLYQKTTGKSRHESHYAVQRLEFFRKHKFANEEAWQLEWKKMKKNLKIIAWCFCWYLFIPTIVCYYDLRQYKKYGL